MLVLNFTLLVPTVPRDVSATHKNKPGQLHISWEESSETYGGVIKYKICHKPLDGDSINECCEDVGGKLRMKTITGLSKC